MDLFQHRTVRDWPRSSTSPAPRGPRRLLHELTQPVAGRRSAVCTYVCVPVRRRQRGRLPAARRRAAGRARAVRARHPRPRRRPGRGRRCRFDELAARATDEILDGSTARSCSTATAASAARSPSRSPGGWRRPAGSSRPSTSARSSRSPGPRGRVRRGCWPGSDRRCAATAPTRTGSSPSASTSTSSTRTQADRIIRNMRAGLPQRRGVLHRPAATGARPAARADHLGGRRARPGHRLLPGALPEWHFLTDTAALVVLDEAGHFFLKYRAEELAEIVTTRPPGDGRRGATARGTAGARRAARRWWLHGNGDRRARGPAGPADPGAGRAAQHGAASSPSRPGQLVSITGSALTDVRHPALDLHCRPARWPSFALLRASSAWCRACSSRPLAGAIVDRYAAGAGHARGDAAAGGCQLAPRLAAAGPDALAAVAHLPAGRAALSVALTFQRLAYTAAVPQLVPKRYLGHANGVVQLISGVAPVVVPLLARRRCSPAIGLGGILRPRRGSATPSRSAVLAVVRFPRPDAAGGAGRRCWPRSPAASRYSWGSTAGLRAMLLFFAVLNLFLPALFLLMSPLVLSFGRPRRRSAGSPFAGGARRGRSAA